MTIYGDGFIADRFDADLDEQIRRLREKLAGLEAQKKRRDEAAWQQFRRERDAALKGEELGKRNA